MPKASLKAGTAVEVIAQHDFKRVAAQLYCVRTPDNDLGYALLLPAELNDCPPLLPTIH